MSGTPLANDAFAELRLPSEPEIAPDGATAIVVVADVVPAEGEPEPGGAYTAPRYRRRLWRVDLAGGDEPRPLTFGDGHDTSPRFAADGRSIVFLRRPNEERATDQVYVLPLAGGEARPLTDAASHPGGVDAVRWLPGGDLLLLHKGGWRDAAGEHRLPTRVTRRGFRMDGAGFVPEVPTTVERIAPDGTSRGVLASLPFPPSAWDVTPDGTGLWFLAPTTNEERVTWHLRLSHLDLATGTLTRPLEHALRGSALSVAPDGAHVAITGVAAEASVGAPDGLWVFEIASGTLRRLVDEIEVSPACGADSRFGPTRFTPVWLDPGRIVVPTFRQGVVQLERCALNGDGLEPITHGQHAITGFDAAGGRAVAVLETPTRPGEVAVVGTSATRSVPDVVTTFNAEVVDAWGLRAPSPERRVRSADGAAEIPYWVLDPARPRDDHAVVLEVHGGPHTAYGYGFLFEFHLLASHGYTVVYGNPRGGSSYGSAFADAIHGRYGTVDADDVLSLLDDALARHPDPEAPVHLTGGSYGGFMTNWLVGHTDRFASAVSQRSICDWVSFFGDSDIGTTFAEKHVGATPWGDLEAMWRQSPLRYVEDVHTPLLLIHSEDDWRCPVGQGIEFFQSLDRLGRTAELLLVPGEGHELSRSGRPDRRAARLDAMVDWFGRYPKRDDAGRA